MAVPDTNTFKLSDVTTELQLTENNKTLDVSFQNAIEENFDVLYKGNKDRLSNFRNYGPFIPLACGVQRGYGNQYRFGTFEIDIEIGTAMGAVSLFYDAQSIPDRFKMIYNGNIVADSKIVGDGLTGDPLSYPGYLKAGDTFSSIINYKWNGNSFRDTGVRTQKTIIQSDFADIGKQMGPGSIFFFKNTQFPTIVKIFIDGYLQGTAFNIRCSCPYNYNLVRLGYSPIADDSCNAVKNDFYMPIGDVFETTTLISSNPYLNSRMPSGYYSDGNVKRYWEQLEFSRQFVGPVENCIEPLVLAILSRQSGSATSACSEFNSNQTRSYYLYGTFATTNYLFRSNNNNNLALDSWYSDGYVARYWDGFEFIGPNILCQ